MHVHNRNSLMITLFNHLNIVDIDFLISSKAAFVETPTAASIILAGAIASIYNILGPQILCPHPRAKTLGNNPSKYILFFCPIGAFSNKLLKNE
uniref:Uncharacterized protein n=1 Tax=Romanomermis culicivorax TaxID=13658 RepID=A0A915L6U9_ROMCU